MPLPELSPLRRVVWMLLAFGALHQASPGVATANGCPWLALASVTLWGASAGRPGRHALWIEGLAGALGWAGVVRWAAFIHPVPLIWMATGYGLYVALSGWLLRRWARSLPLPLAVTAAWMFAETLRAVAPLPFGQEWMRLGTHLNAESWIAGSVRVWGLEGLGWALASLGGVLALVLQRRRPRALDLALGLGPLVLGVAFTVLVPAPATVPGPRVLLVQPNIAQERKMQALDSRAIFSELAKLSRAGVEKELAAGRPLPDLVCWGESMLPTSIVDPRLPAEVEAGASMPPWIQSIWTAEDFGILLDNQHYWVDELLLGADGREPLLGEGTAFLSGAEHLTVRDGLVRRQSGVFVWSGPDRLRGPVTKRFLVPSAETMFGLERIGFVRRVMMGLGGYVPDLHSDVEAPRRLELEARDGRTYRIGASVCYDNAFDEPFTRPLREGPVDFHVVASNEAWFQRSLEFDQMMAFSRIEALATGRSVVRATNSGVSAVIGPDGVEVARLRVGGLDRDVAGTLLAVVPVPPTPELAAVRTPYVRTERFWTALCLLGPLFLAFWGRRREATEAPESAR